MGSQLLSILVAPLGLETPVKEPAIYDPLDEPSIQKGDVLLAVGIPPEAKEAGEVVMKAGSGGAAAVIFKLRGDVEPLIGVAQSAGVALIGTPPEMTWDQLSALLRRAIASAGRMPDGAGDVPMGDLFALANAVAAMVGGPVTIEDPQSRVLAFSSLDEPIDQYRREAILNRRVPEKWIKQFHDAGVFRQLWSTDEVVEVTLPVRGYRRRLVIAVRAGSEVLGSIWVAESKKPLDDEAEAALRAAAPLAALHLIRHRSGEDLERRMRGDLLRSLLEGRGSVEVLASKLGLQAKFPFTVVSFELQTKDDAELALQRERAVDLVSVYCESFRRPATCLYIERTIYALLPTSKRSGVLRLVEGIVGQAEAALGVGLHIGVGSTVSHLREVARSRSEADRMLRVLAGNTKGLTIADVEDLGAHTILLDLQDLASERPDVRSGKLGRLIEHDAAHGTSYVPTLQAYLEAFGDIRKVATDMNVHPNTVKYRIGRLVELSGLDLTDGTERLVIELALRTL